MELKFYKYQGTGNDFIMIDNRSSVIDRTDLRLVQKLCNRKFGVGADGLILIEDKADFDFEMVYFNSDGSQSMCGNGGRCAVSFARFLNIIESEAHFLAIDGEHLAFTKRDNIHLRMKDVDTVEYFNEDYFINTGSPHYVKLVEKVKGYDVTNEGKKIRYSERFKKEGTNVNFVELLGNNSIYVRTYERGVEAETLSCGTGVTASALAVSLLHYSSPVKIETQGGLLEVSFEKSGSSFKNIFLSGPAEMVFEGLLDLGKL